MSDVSSRLRPRGSGTRVPRRGWLLLASALLLASLALLTSVAARAASCMASGPAAGSYTVTVCIGNPSDGATVTGDTQTTATISVTGTSPGIQRVMFYLDGEYLLTDFQAPYSLTLPSDRFVDGARTLEAETLMRDGFVSERASIALVFQNGTTSPPPTATGFTPTSGTSPAPGQAFVVAATGDGAGGIQSAGDVTNLISSWNPNLFLYLGDVYEKGTATEFHNWYRPNGFFGRFNAITNPTIGNHEYENGQAPGYFDYWKSVPHYYSFNARGWHFISLDSTTQFDQINPGTPQYQWLQNDLAANSATCTIAYFHHPIYNIGPEGAATRMSGVWSLFAAHGVDVVLTGHDHSYQRWTRMDGTGAPDPAGIVQFVAGGGGHGVQQFIASDSRVAKGFDSAPQALGALRLELNQHGAAFRYVNTTGTMLDSGSIACSGAPSDTTAPSTPAGLTASASSPHTVNLSWSAATDNVGVTGYRIYRNGALLATSGPATSYTDLTAAAELTYTYQVRARDAAGNLSGLSDAATATTPAGETGLFADGFENGGLSNWTSVTGLTVQQQQVFSGSTAARATTTGPARWAYKTLGSTYADLYYRIRFKVVSQATTANLLKFRTSTGASLLGVYLTNTGRLAYRNDVAAQSTTSTAVVSPGAWHTLQVRVLVNGAASETETWLDDVKIAALSKSESLGTAQTGRVQLGENSADRTYDIAYDTVLVDTSFIATDTSAPTTPTGVTATPQSSTEIRVAWPASTDNVGVTGYTVYRDGAFLVGLPPSTLSFIDTSLGPSSTHAYTVDAFDGAGNHSAESEAVSTATPPDTTPPAAPAGLTVTGVDGDEADLSWSATTDNVGVAGYTIYRNGAPLATVEAGIDDYVDRTVELSTTYTYTVDAFDAADNHSALSNPATATTAGPPDTIPPSTPTEVTAATISSTRVDVSWAASTDNVAVTGYTIFRDGSQLATVGGTTVTYQDATATPGNSYTYRVDAFDAASNHSPQSDPVSASTGGDTTAPSQPAGVTAAAVGPSSVNLSWSASSDNVGVTGYVVYRNGAQLGTVGSGTTAYSDTATSPSTTYTYTVEAVDAAGNHSAQSDPASATTPAPFLIADDFESGNLTGWLGVTGLVVQEQEVFSGSWAARATSSGPAAWAYRPLPSMPTNVYYRVRFKLISQSATVNLLKFRTSTGVSILGVYVAANGKLGYRNDVAGQSTNSSVSVAPGWHTLQVHVVVNGSAGQTETWLDGVAITQLSKVEPLGMTAVGRVQLGENSPDRSYDIAFDTVAVDTSPISP
jgi:chitodextrinase